MCDEDEGRYSISVWDDDKGVYTIDFKILWILAEGGSCSVLYIQDSLACRAFDKKDRKKIKKDKYRKKIFQSLDVLLDCNYIELLDGYDPEFAYLGDKYCFNYFLKVDGRRYISNYIMSQG